MGRRGRPTGKGEATDIQKPLARLLLLLVLGTLWPAAARAETAGCLPGEEETPALVAAVGRLTRFRVARGSVQSELHMPTTLTRAEVASLLVRGMGREEEARARTGEPAFADTASHWASGYIALLKAEGVALGRGDGSFGPDYKATLGEAEIAVARLLRLGADLTPASAAVALQRSGITVPSGCAAGEFVRPERFYLLLDAALQTPFYRRLGIEAPPPVPACTTQEACVQQLQAALQRLSPTNIIGRDEPGLHFPHEQFTRAKAAQILVTLLGLRNEAAARQSEAAFPDLAGHWAAGAAAVLKDLGIVRGADDGRFHPGVSLRVGEGEILLARLLRLGSSLTPAEADAALQARGVRWTWDLGSPTSFDTYGHFLPLLDQALRTPLYARLRAPATEAGETRQRRPPRSRLPRLHPVPGSRSG